MRFVLACFLLMAAAHGSAAMDGMPMFATQAEAEAEAERMGCNGAHQMGEEWMPGFDMNEYFNECAKATPAPSDEEMKEVHALVHG